MSSKEQAPISNSIQQAVEKFREEFKQKSFSGRHSELGKMINCVICSRRHRSAEICLQRFAKNEQGVELIAKGYGHGKGRLHRHWNRRSLQVVDLTRRLIPSYPNGEEDFKKARSRALNLLRKIWHATSQRVQAQQKLSRRINRG